MSINYQLLSKTGELRKRIETLLARLEKCDICPLRCRVNRLKGDLGVCKTGRQAMVSSYGAHFGEEQPLSGWQGSGTLFFTRCNLSCVYCQNADISQASSGYPVSVNRLAEIMLNLQAQGCHNINLVSPTLVAPQIMEAIEKAALLGFNLPIVYNSGGYDSINTLTLMDGVIDIYMPDMKYGNPD